MAPVDKIRIFDGGSLEFDSRTLRLYVVRIETLCTQHSLSLGQSLGLLFLSLLSLPCMLPILLWIVQFQLLS